MEVNTTWHEPNGNGTIKGNVNSRFDAVKLGLEVILETLRGIELDEKSKRSSDVTWVQQKLSTTSDVLKTAAVMTLATFGCAALAVTLPMVAVWETLKQKAKGKRNDSGRS